jgi:hypothetical protein
MMRLATAVRIVRELAVRDPDGMAKRGVRELIEALPHARTRPFAGHVLRDLVRYFGVSHRVANGDSADHARLAAEWLMRAQAVTEDRGLSYGYFPFRQAGGWRVSYPETTGYTVPSLLQYSLTFDRPDAAQVALQMARFVLSSQMASGAVYGGMVQAADTRVPVAFNTGMGLMGLLDAYRYTGDTVFALGARQAAEFLVSDIAEDGHFQSHGPSGHGQMVKTYTCLCAWPLYNTGVALDEPVFCASAVRVGDAVLRYQQPNGWFAHNCLSRRTYAPLLHTIGYTLQGLAELGIVTGEDRFVDAACRGVEPLLPYCEHGFVHGRYFEDWEPAAFSSCLTGAAQVAVVCYRLAAHTGEARYRSAADGVVHFLKGVQRTSSTSHVDRDLVGALGGSFPLVGAYMPNGYPGWATKFLLDALLLQHAQPSRASAAAPQSRLQSSPAGTQMR